MPWKRLHIWSEPGDSFDDVIFDLFDLADKTEDWQCVGNWHGSVHTNAFY